MKAYHYSTDTDLLYKNIIMNTNFRVVYFLHQFAVSKYIKPD